MASLIAILDLYVVSYTRKQCSFIKKEIFKNWYIYVYSLRLATAALLVMCSVFSCEFIKYLMSIEKLATNKA